MSENSRIGRARPESSGSAHSKHKGVNVSATFACLGALAFWSLGPIFIKYLTGYVTGYCDRITRAYWDLGDHLWSKYTGMF